MVKRRSNVELMILQALERAFPSSIRIVEILKGLDIEEKELNSIIKDMENDRLIRVIKDSKTHEESNRLESILLTQKGQDYLWRRRGTRNSLLLLAGAMLALLAGTLSIPIRSLLEQKDLQPLDLLVPAISLFALAIIFVIFGWSLIPVKGRGGEDANRSSLKGVTTLSTDTMSWLQTREGSTLVIATFLASASLLLLAVPNNNGFITTSEIPIVGFVFASIGLIYRQLTGWTIDRVQHNRDIDRNVNDSRYWRNRRDVYYGYAAFREFFVLFFLSLPVTLWLPNACQQPIICHPILWQFGFISNAIIIALILTLSDLGFRWADKHRHQ